MRGCQKPFHLPGGVFGGYSPAKIAFIHHKSLPVDARPPKAVSSTGRGCFVDIRPLKPLSSITRASLWMRGCQKPFHLPGGVFGGYSPAKIAFIHHNSLPVDARRAPDAIHPENTPFSGTERLARTVCPGKRPLAGTWGLATMRRQIVVLDFERVKKRSVDALKHYSLAHQNLRRYEGA